MKVRHSDSYHRKLAAELVENAFGKVIRSRRAKDVPLMDLCRMVGVNDVTAMPMPVEGFLVNTTSGLAIRVNADRTARRQRFTIAHELGHILLSMHQGNPINVKCRSQHFSSEEESLVDTIAAEILMPGEEVGELVRSCRHPWDVIEHMVWEYRVSYTAAIRRVLNLDKLLGVWITGNQTHYTSLSAWVSDSVLAVRDASKIWKAFCWDPRDGDIGEIEVLVRASFGDVRWEQLKGNLRYMSRMGLRSDSQEATKNCWILAWTKMQQPKVQLMLDFGFQL